MEVGALGFRIEGVRQTEGQKVFPPMAWCELTGAPVQRAIAEVD
ncbi:MAG: Uncharacterised protein [Synechococcus sp. MIT S9220]|nr:MAG: Uncharacterised protein [Synechococcus sp. MIT S9220]